MVTRQQFAEALHPLVTELLSNHKLRTGGKVPSSNIKTVRKWKRLAKLYAWKGDPVICRRHLKLIDLPADKLQLFDHIVALLS